MIGSEQSTGHAAIFGASGGIGGALVAGLADVGWHIAAGSRSGRRVDGASSAFAFDLLDEDSIVGAVASLARRPLDLAIVATGVLTLADGSTPEKSYREVTADSMVEAYRINTVGPAMVAKHILPLLPRDRRCVFAVLGARVGSIGDNRLGGWHAYRASKAALAMIVRNLAIEHARTHADGIVVGLHPGTVATRLSAPFQKRIAAHQLVEPETAARNLLTVIAGLKPADSGKVFDWQGLSIPP